jgi:hypothetical protein
MGEQLIDGVHRAETGDDVADVALLKKGQRQTNEMSEQVCFELVAERAAEIELDVGADRRHHLDDHITEQPMALCRKRARVTAVMASPQRRPSRR